MIEQYYTVDDCNTLREVEKYVDDGDYCPQDLINLWKENQDLTKKLSNATALKEESFRQEDILLQENKELKRKRLVAFSNNDCWIYSEDEPNYLRTLVCPVIVSPVYLQHLQENLWEASLWLGLTLEVDAGIWDEDQCESAELCFKASREMLKGFEMEEDGGYR